MSNKNISFFFGAGAEADFELPLGAKFTMETILRKRTIMYNELESFYANRMVQGYITEYKKEFLFRKTSNAFFEIIYRAVKLCHEEPNQAKIDGDTKDFFQYLSLSTRPTDVTKAKFKKNVVDKMYSYIIQDLDNAHPSERYKYKSLLDKMTYYGSIEKDFSSIIDPQEAGVKQFWRFVNYLWSAFFSIALPLLDKSEIFKSKPYYLDYEQNKYRAVLNNLYDVISFLYSNDYLSECSSAGYYNKIKDKFHNRIYNAITTNYTPFVKNVFPNAAYVAGELSAFEYPHKLEVKDITQSRLGNKDFVFPFLLTQAPVKPIIEPKQIFQYAKMDKILRKSKILVIIGYNINSNDNHINSYLRHFVMRRSTHLIFCKYSKTPITDEEIRMEKNSLKKRLYLTTNRNNIHVLAVDGNADSLCNTLNDLICSL